ncbi:MAG TPA: hypothetical protein PKA13_05525 [Geminicoccaceae bacterium]|nr:hypothetical protein [Geminicoccus sp.]HMU49213.1 hypothetical protein [Geminicoccaceae bacterium]
MSVLLDDSCIVANRSGLARGPLEAGLALGLLVAVSACTIGPDTGPDPEVEAAPYPALSTVPPRPRLSYSIEQRREIVDALVSDRANARYDRSMARYEVGLDETAPAGPVPAVVPEPVPPEGGVEARPVEPPEPVPPGGGEIADLAIRQQVLTERNNGRIATFLLILERQLQFNQRAEEAGVGVLPDTVQPSTLPGKPPTTAALPVQEQPAAPEREDALIYLRELFGSAGDGSAAESPAPATVEPAAGPAPASAVAAAPPAETPAAMPAAGPVTLAFEPSSRELPQGYEAAMRATAEAARAGNRRLLVEGHGASPALGLDRARAVASWLMRLGAPPDMVDLKGGGAGEDVIVHLLPAEAA